MDVEDEEMPADVEDGVSVDVEDEEMSVYMVLASDGVEDGKVEMWVKDGEWRKRIRGKWSKRGLMEGWRRVEKVQVWIHMD